VAGPNDPRLGEIDVVLVSHKHGDHVGDRHVESVDAGECGQPDTPVVSAPTTNSVDIALAEGAKIVTGGEMPRFFAGKLQALGGDPSASQLVRFRGSREAEAERPHSDETPVSCRYRLPNLRPRVTNRYSSDLRSNRFCRENADIDSSVGSSPVAIASAARIALRTAGPMPSHRSREARPAASPTMSAFPIRTVRTPSRR